ncbi:MAG: T9SS type A sorting domain-containing protein [Crocinitomicaceae bacterium]|jgi:hypothetical protein
MIKQLLFASSILAAGSTFSQQGLEKIIVEKYYVSNVEDSIGSMGTLPVGSVTYRVFADMLPGYKFQALYGDGDHPLIIKSSEGFFNNEDRGATTANGIPSAQLKNNTVALDSWFSVGAAAAGQLGVLKSEDDSKANLLPIVSNTMLKNNDTAVGILLKDQDGMIAGTPVAVTTVGIDNDLAIFDATSLADSVFKTSNGAVSALGGAAGPTVENRVLLGQFTTKGQFSFELNIQIGTPTAGVSEKYVASNPKAGELTIPSLIYKSPSKTTPVDTSKASIANLLNHNISVFPNPASGKLFIKLDNNAKGTFNAELLTLDGKSIISKQLNTNLETNSIDLSSVTSGVYFVRVSNKEGVYNQRIIVD